MLASEFELQPRGPATFDTWAHPETMTTPLGAMVVELYVAVGTNPDERMVREAKAIVGFLERAPDALTEMVFGHYEKLRAHTDWMAQLGVPLELVATDLANYVTAAVVGVWRDEMDGEVSYDSYVYISPQWEPEHAIYLGLAGKTLYFRDP